MSVRRGDDAATIVLDGNCPVEDAEPLLQLLQASPAASLDWRQVQSPSYLGFAGDPGWPTAIDRPLRGLLGGAMGSV